MQGYYERPWNYTDVISLDIICLYVILLDINNMGSSFDVEFFYIYQAVLTDLVRLRNILISIALVLTLSYHEVY